MSDQERVGYDYDRIDFEVKCGRKNDPNGRRDNNNLEREAKLNQLKEMACDKVKDRQVSFILQEILELI